MEGPGWTAGDSGSFRTREEAISAARRMSGIDLFYVIRYADGRYGWRPVDLLPLRGGQKVHPWCYRDLETHSNWT